jgi:hypothetical protein
MSAGLESIFTIAPYYGSSRSTSSFLSQLDLCNRKFRVFLFNFDHQDSSIFIIDMKRIYKKVFKSKKASSGSIHGLEPATSTSTLITSATDLLPSAGTPTYDATASAQVTAGVSVSVQLRWHL